MPFSRYLAVGSNTQVKTGTGSLYGLLIGGANGGMAIALDAVGIGASPNYHTLMLATASNLTVAYPLPATLTDWPTQGVRFTEGLVVATTSNASVTVIYD